LFLSEQGDVIAERTVFQTCNEAPMSLEATATGFVASGLSNDCSLNRTPWVMHWLADGTQTSATRLPRTGSTFSAACNGDCSQVHVLVHPVAATELTSFLVPVDSSFDGGDVNRNTFDAGVPIASFFPHGDDHSSLTFDGSSWLVTLAKTSYAPSAPGGIQVQGYSGITDGRSAVTLIPSQTDTALDNTTSAWTGDGFFVAKTEYPWRNYSGASPRFVALYRYARNGTLLERRVISTNAKDPQLAWAGGRVALSWVTTARPPTRHLLFLDCP